MRNREGGSGVVLGVDIGATALTVVASGEDLVPGEVVEWPIPRYTGYSVDPQCNPWLLLDVLFSALREAVGTCHVFGGAVEAVSINVGLHSLLALDSGGAPLTSVVNYTDTRSADTARRLVAEYGGELHRLTGVPISPASPAAKLAWFSAYHRDLFEEAAQWTGLKGFVLAQLTGRLVSDTSTWSSNGMLDTRSLDWSPLALDVTGLDRGQLPELLVPTATLPMSAAASEYLGLPGGTPVVVGASGAATTHLGIGAMKRGKAALTMGASAALSVVEDEPAPAQSELVSCHAFADDLWVSRGVFSNGEAVTRWVAESFGGVDVDELLAEAERVPVGADGLIGVPHQAAGWVPWWNPDFRAALVGLRVEHGRAAMTRAMAEGVARQLAMVRDEMVSMGRTISLIRAGGTAMCSPLWGPLLAAALDAPLEIVSDATAPALGAALMAWRGLGRIASLADRTEYCRPGRVVIPDPRATAHFAATRRLAEQLTHLLTSLRAVS